MCAAYLFAEYCIGVVNIHSALMLTHILPSLHLAYDELRAIRRCLNSHFRAVCTISLGFWASKGRRSLSNFV